MYLPASKSFLGNFSKSWEVDSRPFSFQIGWSSVVSFLQYSLISICMWLKVHTPTYMYMHCVIYCRTNLQVVFAQCVNQTFNAFVNYTNRNAKSETSNDLK